MFRFAFVSVNGQNIVGTITNTPSVDALTTAMQSLTIVAGRGTCHTPSFAALIQALNYVNQYSSVYLFTMGFPSNLNASNSIFNRIAYTGAQVKRPT